MRNPCYVWLYPYPPMPRPMPHVPPPPPILIDNEEEYEVDEIIDSRIHRGKLQFLVKWTGYDEPSWQPESDVIGNADAAIAAFYQMHPGAPRRLNLPRRHLRPIFLLTEPDQSTIGWVDQS